MIETGIYFGDIHSYHDLGLVLSSVDIPPAVPKTNYIDIPGGDGSIDLTEVHGDVKYNDRECKFTFTVAKSINEQDWETLKTNVNNALNGNIFKITLDKDPDYYYSGRCSINGYAVNKRLRQIVVNAKVKPWKFKQSKTVITSELTGSYKTLFLPNGRKPVCPVIEMTGDLCVIADSNDNVVFRAEAAGIYQPIDYNFTLRLKEETTKVKVTGNGTIILTYQEADL